MGDAASLSLPWFSYQSCLFSVCGLYYIECFSVQFKCLLDFDGFVGYYTGVMLFYIHTSKGSINFGTHQHMHLSFPVWRLYLLYMICISPAVKWYWTCFCVCIIHLYLCVFFKDLFEKQSQRKGENYLVLYNNTF